MKRSGPPSNGPAKVSNTGGYKGRRGEDDEPSFEEVMMMDDELLVEEMVEIDGKDDVDGGVRSTKWSRAETDAMFNVTEENLLFQWCDIDMTSSQPLTSNPDGKAVVGSLEGPVPVVRLYGVTKNGKSVMATVHGFTPYLYVSAPQGADISDQSLGILRTTLDQKMREKARGNEKKLQIVCFRDRKGRK